MRVQLFKIVPLASLGVGPEVSNNMSKFCSVSPLSGCPCCAPAALGSSDVALRHAPDKDRCLLALICTAAPHNCIGGSEVNCLPPPAEAALMFADPSKMQNMDGVPLPAHWYKAPVQIM